VQTRTLLRAAAGVGAGAAAAFAWARWIEPAWIETTFLDIAWRGPALRLALLTDLHAGPEDARRVRRIVKRTLDLRPDLVLFGGDFVDGLDADPAKLAALAPLAALRARLGVFAVLGNHDSQQAGEGDIQAAVERLGIRVLDNEHVALPGGAVLVGLGSFRAGKSDPHRAFAGIDPDAPAIVLVHNFKSLEEPGVGRFDLALAGHTHGGQGCVPFTKVCPFLEDDMKPYSRGLYHWPAGGELYVSRGLGTSGVDARLGARPEIACVRLDHRRPQG
jgi:uncharacterized protein